MKLTQAQSLLIRMGVSPAILFLPRFGKSYSNTKRGPGRKHWQGRISDPAASAKER